MLIDLGKIRPGATLRIPFSSFDKDDGSSITMTNFAVGDILIYKDGGTTERASTSGFTATTDFDSKTGKHLLIIDLADDTTADFFKAGAEYLVGIDAVTIDAVVVGGWVARFKIGYTQAILDTFLATLSSQTSFTLTAGPAEDDALNGMWAILHDKASAVQFARGIVLDYTGSTKTVTLAAGPTFTITAGDNFSLIAPMPLQPTVTARTLAVNSTGDADGNVTKNAGTAITAASGIQEVKVASIASNAITAASAASDFGTEIAAAVTAASPTVQNVVDGVLNEAGSSHSTSGTIGKLITDIEARLTAAISTALAAIAPATLRGIVAASGSSTTLVAFNTSTGINGGAPSATDDIYNDRLLLFTSGALAGSAYTITDYNGTTKIATVATMVGTPAAGVTFVIQ